MLSKEYTWALVFDFDGVIIDSKANVMEAYRLSGVSMPEEAWGKPWEEWLIKYCGGDQDKAAAIHQEKNEHYAEMTPRFNPAFAVFADYTRKHPLNTFILTGASMDAVLSTAPWATSYTMPGRTLDLKITTLNIMGERGPVMYIDDMAGAVDRVNKETTAEAVLYDRGLDLKPLITEWRKRWTL